jgi:hypothetical protein
MKIQSFNKPKPGDGFKKLSAALEKELSLTDSPTVDGLKNILSKIEAADLSIEALPECQPNDQFEGAACKEATTHLNAGGTVRVASPSEALEYFRNRFSQFVPAT